MSTILVVDDEPSLCASLQRLLSNDWNVEVARDEAGALEQAAIQPPSLLMVDWYLSGGENGLELARRMRHDHPELPVIVMTGDPAADVQRAVDAVPGCFLVGKPCPYEKLLDLVRSILTDQE